MEVKRIKLQNLSNTRDLGGFPGADGKTVCHRRLIRSSELSKASQKDLETLFTDYNVKTVVDLRMDAERVQTPAPEMQNVNNVWLPLLDGSFFGIARDENSVNAWMRLFEDPDMDPTAVFKEMYRKLMFSDYVKPLFRTFFDLLLDGPSGAVLWHCSAGKDRAGIITVLVLMALGVDRDVILQDYMMTGPFSKKELRKLYCMIRFLVHDKRKKKCYRTLLGVDESYITQLFEIVDRDYGGDIGYLTKFVGLTYEEIARLRKLYLTEE